MTVAGGRSVALLQNMHEFGQRTLSTSFFPIYCYVILEAEAMYEFAMSLDRPGSTEVEFIVSVQRDVGRRVDAPWKQG